MWVLVLETSARTRSSGNLSFAMHIGIKLPLTDLVGLRLDVLE